MVRYCTWNDDVDCPGSVALDRHLPDSLMMMIIYVISYSDYKENPSYQKYDGYISNTIAKYGSSTLDRRRYRHSSVDRIGKWIYYRH